MIKTDVFNCLLAYQNIKVHARSIQHHKLGCVRFVMTQNMPIKFDFS